MTFLSSPARGRRATGLRLLAVSAVVAAVSTLGLVAVSAPAAQAASESGSEVTVKWRGGNDPALQKYQVDHEKLLSDGKGNDAGTGHWDDFKDLEVTVSKTKDLRDEAVVVTTSGTRPTSLVVGGDNTAGMVQDNYLQVFQCWGPDPSDAAFAETCQFGAWDAAATPSPATIDAMAKQLGNSGAQGRGRVGVSDVAFQAATRVKSEPEDVSVGGTDITIDGTGAFYDASTSNEQPVAPVDAEGRSRTVFTVQTAVRQPYLGCGNRELAGMRCWLVIVPRGTHSGSIPGRPASDCALATTGGGPAGQVTRRQGGSPLSDGCNFFQNRVVVPLDFAEPTSGCSPGAPETRILGSELLAEAMSSWQRGLCAASGSAYNLTTNSGDVTRSQLLTGQANLAVVANPLRPGNIGAADEALLSDAHLAYAPVANAALTVSFVAADVDANKNPTVSLSYRDLKVTPRLLAKVLTQSYTKDSPNTGVLDDAFLPGNAQNMTGRQVADPEWAALGNPGLTAGDTGGTFVVSGPQGEDVVELLWRYIQADADAVAFLRGEPDPWGNTVNPYYLPSTNVNAAGGGLPYDLAVEPIDNFPRADQREAPSKEVAEEKHRGLQVDSLTMLPLANSLLDTAARIARADTKYTIEWDPNKIVSPGVTGQWLPKVPQIGGIKYVAGVTDLASAARYATDSMQLAIPLPEKTTKESVSAARTFVAPTATSLTAAVSAMKVDEESGIAVPDFASLPEGAYPLTAPLYAVADVSSVDLDETKREQLATFIDYSAGAGNVVGFGAGQLPEGYAPLTPAQVAQSAEAAALIRNPPLDDESAGGSDVPSESGSSPAGATVSVTTEAPAGAPAGTTATTVGSTAPTATEATPAGVLGPQAALGGALVAGVVGLAASPLLLRRRGVGA